MRRSRGPVRASQPIRALAGLLGLLVVLGGCSAARASTPPPAPLPPNPFAGAGLWVDPQSTAQRQVDADLRAGKAGAAAALAPITGQPVATWLSGPADPYAVADRVTRAATAAAALPVLVAYHRPNRDCGSYSAGGSTDPAAYLAWVGRLAAGVGDRRAVVVLEPDAVPQAASGQCGGAEQAGAVYTLLGQAVDVLRKQPHVLVYVDAGHSDWIGDVGSLAAALRSSGVERANGFSLNVANFRSTAETLDYGQRLSGLLGQAQFVVDTSRNGGTPPTVTEGIDAWCNPRGVGLGQDPRVGEARAVAVAFLWIKEPGASDGNCRPGEPAAGVFWPEYARRLIDQRS